MSGRCHGGRQSGVSRVIEPAGVIRVCHAYPTSPRGPTFQALGGYVMHWYVYMIQLLSSGARGMMLVGQDVRSSDPTVDTNRIAFSITCPTRSRTGELRRSCSPADIEPGVTRINGQEFCIPYQRRFYSDMPLSATQRDDPCIMPLVDPLMH